MYDSETAKRLPWMVPYFKQTEAEACRKFWSVAREAGVQFRRDDDRMPQGWTGFRETYRPIVVPVNPQGIAGRWTLQLSEQVRFLEGPNKASNSLPIVVRHLVRIEPYNVADMVPPCSTTLVRPLMRIIPKDGNPPDIYLARPSVLERHAMPDTLQVQARYMTWLILAQQAALEMPATQ